MRRAANILILVPPADTDVGVNVTPPPTLPPSLYRSPPPPSLPSPKKKTVKFSKLKTLWQHSDCLLKHTICRSHSSLAIKLTSLKIMYLTNFCQHPGFSAPVGITAISVNTQRNTRKKITALSFQTSLPACSNGIMGNPTMGNTKTS